MVVVEGEVHLQDRCSDGSDLGAQASHRRDKLETASHCRWREAGPSCLDLVVGEGHPDQLGQRHDGGRSRRAIARFVDAVAPAEHLVVAGRPLLPETSSGAVAPRPGSRIRANIG